MGDNSSPPTPLARLLQWNLVCAAAKNQTEDKLFEVELGALRPGFVNVIERDHVQKL